MTSLSHRDKFGRRVCITRPGYWNPDKIKFSDLFCGVFKLYSMISEEEKTQIAGCTAIIDAKNFGFKQLRNISFEDIRVVVNFIQVKIYHLLLFILYYHLNLYLINSFLPFSMTIIHSLFRTCSQSGFVTFI